MLNQLIYLATSEKAKKAQTGVEKINGGNKPDSLESNIGTVISAIIGFVGIVAVIVIILGGIQYMMSQGDPGKTKKAKDTILYGLIGLIVCLLAFAIVQFVINAMQQ
jgi:multisubunit Na+/H+ antiporter MnhB subunit